MLSSFFCPYLCQVILRFYRSNQPVIAFSVPVAALFAMILYFAGNYSGFQYSGSAIIPSLDGPFLSNWPFVSQAVALLLVIFQALYFNRIISEQEVFDKITFIPSFVYVVMSSALSVNGMLTGLLLSITFLLFSLDKVLSVYRQVSSKHEAFIAGLWAGVAVLFFVPALLFILFIWIAISVLKRSNWREWILALAGTLLPLFFLMSFRYAFTGETAIKIRTFIHVSPGEFPFLFQNEIHAMMLVLFSFLLLASLGSWLARMSGTVMKTRRQRQVLLLYFVFGVCSALAGWFTGNTFSCIMLIVPFSVFISSWLVHSKVGWMADGLFYIFCLLLVTSVAINGKLIDLSFLFL